MVLMLLAGVFAGFILGLFTGLVPGIHVNTVSLFILLFAPKENEFFVSAIISMAVTQSFVDFIPTTVLGLPEEETAMS